MTRSTVTPGLSATLIAVAWFVAAGACASDAPAAGPVSRRLVLRPAAEEYARLRGRWRGTEVGGGPEWTFSFGDAYTVVVSNAAGEWYQGTAGLHFELGTASDGTTRVPPGSGVIDVDVDAAGSSPERFDGQTSLGVYYFTSPTDLKVCASRPGVFVRALSYDASSPSVRCFRLAKTSSEPLEARPVPVEK